MKNRSLIKLRKVSLILPGKEEEVLILPPSCVLIQLGYSDPKVNRTQVSMERDKI